MAKLFRMTVCSLLALSLFSAPVLLTGCSNSSASGEEQTQDDCYGDDLPAINN